MNTFSLNFEQLCSEKKIRLFQLENNEFYLEITTDDGAISCSFDSEGNCNFEFFDNLDPDEGKTFFMMPPSIQKQIKKNG